MHFTNPAARALILLACCLTPCFLSACSHTTPRAAAPRAAAEPIAAASSITPARRNAYRQVNLVANSETFKPQLIDKDLRDGWGIAIRPPGAGGHFWISNRLTGNTTTYVGDVNNIPLHQDELTAVDIPPAEVNQHLGDPTSQPTGQVYAGRSKTDFLISGANLKPDGPTITGASTFIFAGLDGTLSGWRDGMKAAQITLDWSKKGSAFTGLAITESATDNRLYVADFGLEEVAVFDAQWKPIKVAGDFRDPKAPENFRIYNFQFLEGKLYATWARVGDHTGEEDRHPGYGYISVFDTEGRLLQSFEHRMELNAPWGVALAPENFGALSGSLLVGNFGDGTIVAYDKARGTFIDYLRDEAGQPLKVDGLWGILFGNGVKLGQTNHLYFAAGPNDQEDGLFGKLVPVTP